MKLKKTHGINFTERQGGQLRWLTAGACRHPTRPARRSHEFPSALAFPRAPGTGWPHVRCWERAGACPCRPLGPWPLTKRGQRLGDAAAGEALRPSPRGAQQGECGQALTPAETRPGGPSAQGGPERPRGRRTTARAGDDPPGDAKSFGVLTVPAPTSRLARPERENGVRLWCSPVGPGHTPHARPVGFRSSHSTPRPGRRVPPAVACADLCRGRASLGRALRPPTHAHTHYAAVCWWPVGREPRTGWIGSSKDGRKESTPRTALGAQGPACPAPGDIRSRHPVTSAAETALRAGQPPSVDPETPPATRKPGAALRCWSL